MGCTIPIPPASDTAATNSGLEHGYMAPHSRGTVIPASRVRGVSRGFALTPHPPSAGPGPGASGR